MSKVEARSQVFAPHIKQPDGCTLGVFATLGKAAPSLEGDSWEGTQMGAASREHLD